CKMALDPRTREGLLAGWELNRQRRVRELLQKMPRPPVADRGHETSEDRPMLARIPDLVQVITAYRAWRAESVNGQVRLFALGMDVVWEPREKVEAECIQWASWMMRRLSSNEAWPREHEAPDFHCCCGIWGFKSVENLLSALGQRHTLPIVGKVSLWGRV